MPTLFAKRVSNRTASKTESVDGAALRRCYAFFMMHLRPFVKFLRVYPFTHVSVPIGSLSNAKEAFERPTSFEEKAKRYFVAYLTSVAHSARVQQNNASRKENDVVRRRSKMVFADAGDTVNSFLHFVWESVVTLITSVSVLQT